MAVKLYLKKSAQKGLPIFKKEKKTLQFGVGVLGDDRMHSVRLHLHSCALQPQLIRECKYTVHGHECVCV